VLLKFIIYKQSLVLLDGSNALITWDITFNWRNYQRECK